MGACLDQAGNAVYNKPVETAMCPSGTVLKRAVAVTNPYPGRTIITQDYRCFDSQEKSVKEIGPLPVMAARFLEYFLLGSLLICVRGIVWHVKPGR